MNTLSKEDVVRVDNDLLAMIQKHFPSLPLDDRYTDWGKWLGFAKAVYSHGEQAARADLVAENERLKSLSVTNIMVDVVPSDGSGLEVYAKSVDELVNLLSELGEKAEDLESVRAQLTATRTALAAAEAREAKFIAALDQAESALGEIRDFPLTYLEVSEALSQPRDDSALREMIAGVYEECEKVCELMNYTDPQPHHYAYAIRALAEKAKGK